MPSTDDNPRNMARPLEEQVARIHEFVPVREQNISLINISIKMHAFTESHQVNDIYFAVEILIKNRKNKLPYELIGCVIMDV